MNLKIYIFVVSLFLFGFFVAAQTTPPPPSNSDLQQALPAADSMTEENMIVEGESYYRHSGERDPFSPLIRSSKGGGASGVIVKRGTKGLSQFTVDQCILEAVVKIGDEEVAWFQGPNLKPFKAKVGDVFADGVIIDISYSRGEVIVQQQLDDPTQIKPFRNVSLKIRSTSQSLEGEAQ
ncbi:MAG: hypothetical protein ACE14Q_03380 [Acidobacteriota bacterium]|nr:hypothetical protein [Thermoanaerobaculaceae bacterium]